VKSFLSLIDTSFPHQTDPKIVSRHGPSHIDLDEIDC
jgi:hypothetical protein